MKTSRLTIVLLALVGPAASPVMAASRATCRRACRDLVADRCAGLFKTDRRCRAGVLRECRKTGTAQCDAASACVQSCGAAATQCENAVRAVGHAAEPFATLLVELTCGKFAQSRCAQHGLDYCSAAGTRNGCNRLAAEDHRGESLVQVGFAFDGVGYDYSPECILVSPGTTVRFHGFFSRGSFDDEPLVGGDAPTPDPASPFSPPTTSGTTRDFVLSQEGTFPYFGGDFGQFTSSRPFGTGVPWGAVIVDAAE